MAMCNRQMVFDKVRPLCVQLSKDHSRKNIVAVTKALEGIDRGCIQDLQEYLLFPLRIILKQPTKYSEDFYTDLFTLMERILGCTRVWNWELFTDLFTLSCVIISSPTEHGRGDGKATAKSEDLKAAVVQNIKTLVSKSDYSVIQRLFSIQSLPVLGLAVSILLDLADTEKCRSLKVSAIKCLTELSQVDGKYCNKVRVMLGDTFASFLPGITITLCKIITGDQRQGHSVVATAIYAWTKIVGLTMDDILIEESQSRVQPSVLSGSVDDRIKNLAIKRDSTWVEMTGKKLNVLVKQICKIRGHSNWKVRMALAESAGSLLQGCTRSLHASIPDFMEILVGLISDEYPNVANKSRKILNIFTHTHLGPECRPLVEMLEENLHNLSMSLPRIIRSVDEDKKMSALSLMSGYIDLLGSDMKHLLMSSSHLKRLSMSLIQVFELDTTDIKIIEERTRWIGHDADFISPVHVPDVIKPRKNFKHFHDRKIEKELKNICRLLGYYGSISLLVDHFLDLFHDSILHKMQATMIINELMMGAAGVGVNSYQENDFEERKESNIGELESIIEMLIDEYLSPSNLYLVTSPQHNHSVRSTPENRLMALEIVTQETGEKLTSFNRNILQICLYLEGIGSFATVLKDRYIPYLMKTIYPLLEKLGDETAYISSTAYLSLCDICHVCQYKSIGELVQRNADYLVNAISLRLRHFYENKKSPLVLKVMLQYSSCDILPLIDDTVQEILESLDDNYEQEAFLFLSVLYELVKAVNRWYKDSAKKGSKDSEDKQLSHNPYRIDGNLDVVSYIKEYLHLKKVSEGEDIENTQDDASLEENAQDADEMQTDQKKEPPLHVKAVKEIMLRSKHLLSSRNPNIRLLTLDTIAISCQALQSHQDELLPLVHEIWMPFTARFVDQEKHVTKKAVETLVVMADTSRDFICRRCTKDVFPKLLSFLEKQAEISKGSSKAYLYTVNFKLQQCVLSQIGNLCNQLGVLGNNLDLVSSVCVLYLSARQPNALQKIATETCTVLISLDPDPMWLKLCDLYHPKEFLSYVPLFKPVKFKSTPGTRNEFTDNVVKLLKLLEMGS
ncbi:TELO2-interacting protein 1 homolog [Ostrea edulis]|uniref:TELO2-interacting protein 1 homolog n=1 Tax=Ostrea edulis TaxID=37623 RepID=UPI0024AFEFE9|nr:TELO2-interacting protein 1 homolog [Ostrea edulis]XP_056022188.1 TELO2-interacting protein 1 homolog [Ostrea edulis]XP_056022190.1 TELO2-interacting protein 1 homolog [Ostrea edulis]